MNCSEFEILLCDYIDGTLDSAQRQALEAHQQECAGCAQFAREVTGAVAFMERVPEVEPPPELLTRISFAVPNGKTRRDAKQSWFSQWLQPILQPKFAMGMAMTILSFSMLGRLAGVEVRQLKPAGVPILAGSEGTLVAIFSTELKISPLPREKGLGLVFFASVGEAMQATVALLDLKPAAIEHIDRPLLDQTKGQLHFQAARDLLELDAKPCAAILLVEFYEDVTERLSILQTRKLGLRTKVLTDAREMELVWSVRKAGLNLLTGCIGASKPVAFIEDAVENHVHATIAKLAINRLTVIPFTIHSLFQAFLASAK